MAASSRRILDTGPQVGGKDAVSVTALGLGLVHRQIGILENFVHVLAMRADQRDAEACRGVDPVAGDVDRVGQGGYDPSGQGFRFRNVGDPLLQKGELVAAEAGQGRVLVDQQLQPLGDRLQKLIADIMAERIVDGLEAVDIQKVQRMHAPRPCRLQQQRLDAVRQIGPVGQAGQPVMKG